jgi:hypothetical protein
MSTIAERLSAVDTNLKSILNNVNSELTDKGKTEISDLSDVATAISELKNPTGTVSITQNGTVDVTNYAEADVSVSGGGGGKNIQFVNGFYSISANNTYNPSSTGLSLTVNKTGSYKVKWESYKSYSSGDGSTALYINNSMYGALHMTWTDGFYNNGNLITSLAQYQKNELSGVSLQQGDNIEIRAGSRGSSYQVFTYFLYIEEE